MGLCKVAVKCLAIVPAFALALMGTRAAWAQDATGATPAAHGGAVNHPQTKAKPAPKPQPQAKAVSLAVPAFDIIPCADATGKIHKCIRIDPLAGEINDPAKGASYRVIFGQ